MIIGLEQNLGLTKIPYRYRNS